MYLFAMSLAGSSLQKQEQFIKANDNLQCRKRATLGTAPSLLLRRDKPIVEDMTQWTCWDQRCRPVACPFYHHILNKSGGKNNLWLTFCR